MKHRIRALAVAALSLCVAAAMPAGANVIIATTRVIFPAKQGEVTVRLSNENSTPALVEAWMDDGDPHSTPDTAKVPFLVTPPLFRMDPHKDQSLRIIGSPPGLPKDRESLFWLNVLEIPPKPNALEMADKNYLQLAIRSRLKFFYRPAGLPGDPIKAPDTLTWKEVATGKGYALEAHNPSPYYVTIVGADVGAGGNAWQTTDPAMVAPFGTQRVSFPKLDTVLPAGAVIQFRTINDYGAVDNHESKLMP